MHGHLGCAGGAETFILDAEVVPVDRQDSNRIRSFQASYLGGMPVFFQAVAWGLPVFMYAGCWLYLCG